MSQLVLIHPGEILQEEFLDYLELTPEQLAEDLRMNPFLVKSVLLGQNSIDADFALRLGRYFNLPAQFWLNLQAEYDLRVARNAASFDEIVPCSAEVLQTYQRSTFRTS